MAYQNRVVWALVAAGTLCISEGKAGSGSFALRSSPVLLRNPDGRCVRNAFLQATIPMMLDVMRIDAERRGKIMADIDWFKLIREGSSTRMELTVIALARTALTVNGWSTDLPVDDYNYFSATVAGMGYGLSDKQYGQLMRDIADGISRLTVAQVSYCQLPADRDLPLSAGEMGLHVQQQLGAYTAPDYLIIDGSSSRLTALDRRAGMSTQLLSDVQEQALPFSFAMPLPDGTVERYELVSFCNYERLGIVPIPSWCSRLAGCGEVLSWIHRKLSVTDFDRHATAVVRYGDSWFVPDNTCIWHVEAEGHTSCEIGQALLNQYPGMRCVLVYRKVTATQLSGAEHTKDHDVKPLDLSLKKLLLHRNAAVTEQSAVHYALAGIWGSWLVGGTLVYAAAWRGLKEWGMLSEAYYSQLVVMWLHFMVRPNLSRIMHHCHVAQMLSRMAHERLQLPAHNTWMSSLYSKPAPDQFAYIAGAE